MIWSLRQIWALMTFLLSIQFGKGNWNSDRATHSSVRLYGSKLCWTFTGKEKHQSECQELYFKAKLGINWNLETLDWWSRVCRSNLYRSVHEITKSACDKTPETLQDVSDILQEINAAKSDGSIPGLHALDSIIVLKPVFDHLTKDIWNPWRKRRYKERHNENSPPFS